MCLHLKKEPAVGNCMNLEKVIKSIILYYICALALIASSCTKERIDITYVPSYLKQMLPYTHGQVIRFIDTNGQTIEALISKRTDFVNKASCANCDPYAKEEYIEYTFSVGIHSFISLSVDNRPFLFMSILSPYDNYKIGGGFNFEVEAGISQPLCNGSRQTCLASITLNGKTYSDVLEVISGATEMNQLTKAYYTVNKGLIGFVYGNGMAFTASE